MGVRYDNSPFIITEVSRENCCGNRYCAVLVHQRSRYDHRDDRRRNDLGHRDQCSDQYAGSGSPLLAWPSWLGMGIPISPSPSPPSLVVLTKTPVRFERKRKGPPFGGP